jgi:hypothetical protein
VRVIPSPKFLQIGVFPSPTPSLLLPYARGGASRLSNLSTLQKSFRRAYQGTAGQSFDHPAALNIRSNARSGWNDLQASIRDDQVVSVQEDTIGEPSPVKRYGQFNALRFPHRLFAGAEP